MESLQNIKIRINGIASTRQITQSMRLVSTSKVQKARARMEANRLFLQDAEQLVQMALLDVDCRNHRYVKRAGNRAGIVVISGDRGLCGGYNINVNRTAARLVRQFDEAKIITIGSKARDHLRRRHRDKIAESFTGMSENPFYEDVCEIVATIQGWYDREEVDQLHLVYTQFASMLSQSAVSRQLLPLQPDGQSGGAVYCEPGGGAFLSQVTPHYLAALLFGAILESSLCEQSARITSMDSAVKNSDEMISTLTLRYNQARQSAITQEINEIVSGANAV